MTLLQLTNSVGVVVIEIFLEVMAELNMEQGENIPNEGWRQGNIGTFWEILLNSV